MSARDEFLVFFLDGQRHAVPLSLVERVVQAVAVTPLPGAPVCVLGAIDVAGRILPVFSLRRRLQLPERPLRVRDQFVIARACTRAVALLVDEVQAVSAAEVVLADAALLFAGAESATGLVRLPDGLLLIHDLERFLSDEDDRALVAVLGLGA